MIIGFDSYFLTPAARGLGRFATALAKNLPGAVMLSKSTRQFASGKPRLFPIWEQFILPFLAWRHKCHCIISSYNTAPLFVAPGCRRILVVHDLIYMDEQWFVKGPLTQSMGRIYRKTFAPIAVRKADLVVTVSEYSRQQISERFNIKKEQIFLLPNSYDKKFFIDLTVVRDKHLIFSVAGEAPSKNLSFLIDVFAQLHKKNENLKLVVAGVSTSGRDKFIRQAVDLGIANSIDLLPKVSDEDIARMYSSCALFVCASLKEGFGIPLLEAMASGTNICASNASSLPEVCGEAADYFSPTSAVDAVSVISNALAVGLTTKKRTAGVQQCEYYSNAMFTSRCHDLSLLIENLCKK